MCVSMKFGACTFVGAETLPYYENTTSLGSNTLQRVLHHLEILVMNASPYL